MVDIAQLAEHRIVVPGVEGSNPFTHPICNKAKGRSFGSGPEPCSAFLLVDTGV